MCRYCRNLKKLKDSEIADYVAILKKLRAEISREDRLLVRCLIALVFKDFVRDETLVHDVSSFLRKVVIK